MEVATTSQVADFYNVDQEAIKSIVYRHKEEINKDGYITKQGKEIRKILEGCTLQLTKIEPKLGHFIVHNKDTKTKITYSNVALFPKRAILRVGMLLRGSEVAKEVRTQ